MATAMAYLLSNGGTKGILIWMRNGEKAEKFNRLRQNTEYLPGLVLPKTIVATDDLTDALDRCNMVVLALPSHAVRNLIESLNEHSDSLRILSVVKGLDHTDGCRISTLLNKVLQIPLRNIAVMSGPNFASELVGNTYSVTVMASTNHETLHSFRDPLESDHLIIYPSTDLAGVEVGSVLKNIIAIAVGIVDGLGYGANTKGAVFAACINEALSIGTDIFSAKPETILGPACLGDAITTGFSTKSRNYLLGLLLAKRISSADLNNTFLSEGRSNTSLIRALVEKNGVKAPVIEFVHQTMIGGNPYQAFSTLWKDLKSMFA